VLSFSLRCGIDVLLQARYFKQMLLASDHLGRVKKMRVGEQELEILRNRYDVALGKLRDIYVVGK